MRIDKYRHKNVLLRLYKSLVRPLTPSWIQCTSLVSALL